MVDQAKTADLVLALGGDQLLMGQHERAIARFREAIRLDPNCAEAYAWLGKAYKEMGRTKEAEEAFQNAIRVRPDFALAHYNLGLLYVTSDQSEKALAEYEFLKAIHPIRAERLLEQIHGAVQPNDIAAPEPVEAAPQAPVDRDMNGEPPVDESREPADSRSDEIPEPVELDPNGDSRRPAADADVQTADIEPHEDAEAELLSAAPEVAPVTGEAPPPHSISAEIERWKQAASADPRDAAAHWELGRAYLESGDHLRAAESIEKAIANRRDFGGSHPESVRDSVAMCHALGECYERMGRFESAVGIYEQSLDMDPDNVDSHFHLGLVAVVLGNRREAVERYRSLARINPERATPLLQRLLQVLSK